MSKTVQNVKNSLKFKANPKGGVLSVRVGVKKFVVPVDARLLSDGKYLFLSFPAVSELYMVEGKSLSAMAGGADASEAHAALTPAAAKKRGRRRSAPVEVPPALAAALKAIPAGFKLGISADGTPRLVKTRKRRASKK
jgi:hypothetical protein